MPARILAWLDHVPLWVLALLALGSLYLSYRLGCLHP